VEASFVTDHDRHERTLIADDLSSKAGEIIAGRSVWPEAARLLDFLVVDHGKTALQGRGDDAAGSLEENRGRGCSGSCLVTLLSFACRAASTIHVMSGTCQNKCVATRVKFHHKKDCRAC